MSSGYYGDYSSNDLPSVGFNSISSTSDYSNSTYYWNGEGTTVVQQSLLISYVLSTSKAYNMLRPTMPTVVTPWFTIMKTLGLTNTGVLSITGLMVLGWLDPRLMWDSNAYNGITQINLRVTDIWYPPLTLVNSVTPGSITPGSSTTAQVYSTGLVYLYIPLMTTSTCSLNLGSFPYDLQTCTLLFTSMDSNGTGPGVNFTASNASSLPLNYYSKTGEFALTSATLASSDQFCVSSCFSTFVVSLVYSRRSSYYVMTVIIPAFFLTFLLALTLIIPSENSIKINVACTLMVSLYTLQQTVARLLPATDSAPLLSTGMVCSLGLAAFCAVSTIISVITRMLQPQMSVSCGTWLDYLSCLLCLRRKSGKVFAEVTKMESISATRAQDKNQVDVEKSPVDSSNGVLDQLLEEQSGMLKDISLQLGVLVRSSRDVAEKRYRDGEQSRRWRTMDAFTNTWLFFAYLAVALACMLLFETPIKR